MSVLSTTADLRSWSQIRREKVIQAQVSYARLYDAWEAQDPEDFVDSDLQIKNIRARIN